MKVFGVFEGGGIRGFAHIGALRALERRRIEFEQVAGTSIGAVVAALVAAGYSAEELFAEAPSGEQSGAAVIRLDEIFSKPDLNALRRISRHLGRMRWAGKWLNPLRLRAPFEMKSSFWGAFGIWFVTPFLWIAAPVVYFRYWRAYQSVWRSWGMVDTDALKVWLDACLRRKLRDVPVERQIQFKDLRTPLRVVIADVQNHTLQVIGEDAEAFVVDAVIASASVPFFFRPKRTDQDVFVDGGFLSNVPAWVFDPQRAALVRTLPTLTLRLMSRGQTSALAQNDPVGRFAPRLLRTALDGARMLELRRIDDHHVITIEADVGFLDFERIDVERSALIAAGEAAVDQYFSERLGPFDPVQAQKILSAIAAFTRETLGVRGFVRACAVLPFDDEYLKVAAAANMTDDADDQLLIRRSSIGVASAFREREPVIVTLADFDGGVRRDPRYKYEHAARPPTLVTICAIPFFADPDDWRKAPQQRGEPMGMLCIDADESLRAKLVDADAEDRVASYAQFLGERLRRREVQEFGVEEPAAGVGGDLVEIAPGVEIYQRKQRRLQWDDKLLRLQEDLDDAA